MYKEAMDYDMIHLKKCSDNLKSTSTIASLLSVITFAAAIRTQIQLESAQGHPPSEIVTAAILIHTSFPISLFNAIAMMMGRQWLNQDL
ncbi:hypothetical protein BDM02DRAFT_3182859 [Thelephora ganbajun]|uniref:Uncharacterized protein n=1 Tax=Thelephora ganbajun TaxID=370292 RepID=A0ACB6ZVH7_THEGA|nr:hypothetical protein BDM02DRAFT_3182859 [Thelephora ganbajun]